MGAEGSRYEHNPDFQDDDIFGPDYLQSPPKAKPEVPQATTSTLVDIHNGIIIGPDMSAIRKLKVSESLCFCYYTYMQLLHFGSLSSFFYMA